jgi:cytochrome b6-f complex iron-sulfur subunit
MFGFIKAILGICQTKPLSSDLWSLEEDKVRVKLSQMPEPLPKGGAVYLAGQGLSMPILILRTEDDQYLAFANRCTHAKRKLDPVPGESKLRCCSVFHSTFDLDGKRLTGPAKDSLTRYTAEKSNGDLIIAL